MASLVRQQVTRYVDANGKRVPKKTRGAKRVSEESAKWYGQGVPGYPTSKRFPLAADRAAAQRMLDKLVRDAERGHAGIISTAQKPIAEYLIQYEKDIELGLASRSRKRRKPSPEYLAIVMTRVRNLIQACKWVTVQDVASSERTLATYLNSKVGKPHKRKSESGMSAQTAQFYLSEARRFAWWLSKQGATIRPDVFDNIPSFDPKHNRIHARRDLLPDEVGKLLIAARAGRLFKGLSGEDRYFLYLTAFSSGFRAKELSRLDPVHFEFNTAPPCLCLPAGESKNKKPVRQPIPPAVAMELKPWLSSKPEGKPVWPGTWKDDPVEILREDLENAGIPYAVDSIHGKQYADFHALRHSFTSALAKIAGIGPKELQELARHSDPRLTLSVYAHTRQSELGDAVSRMELPGPAAEKQATAEEVAAIMLGVVRLLLVTRPVTQTK